MESLEDVNFSEWLDEILEFSKQNDGEVWFRGHGKGNYRLIPGIYRDIFEESEKKLDIHQLNKVVNREKHMYFEFLSLGGLISEQQDWNTLFQMQHYGAPTRLLDWTESLNSALYFATENWNSSEDKPHIWVLNPIKLNQVHVKMSHLITLDQKDAYTDSLEWAILMFHDKLGTIDSIQKKQLKKYKKDQDRLYFISSIAVFPKYNSTRLLLQNGRFTIHQLLPIPFENNRTLIENGILKRFDIPWHFRDHIKQYLKLTGTNTFTIFPDLEGLSNKIKNDFNNFIKDL